MPRRRGVALIINNWKFTNGLTLTGEGIDGRQLSNQLKKYDYRVILKNNLKASQMIKEIKKTRKRVSADHDSLIVVICSLGDEVNGNQIIYGKDSDAKNADKTSINVVKDVIEAYDNKNCRKLRNALKLFIIDCSRGDAKLKGINASKLNIENGPVVIKVGNKKSKPKEKKLKLKLYTKTIVLNAAKNASKNASKNAWKNEWKNAWKNPSKASCAASASSDEQIQRDGSILIGAYVDCLENYAKTHNIKEFIELIEAQIKMIALADKSQHCLQIENIAECKKFLFEKQKKRGSDEVSDEDESESDAKSSSLSSSSNFSSDGVYPNTNYYSSGSTLSSTDSSFKGYGFSDANCTTNSDFGSD